MARTVIISATLIFFLLIVFVFATGQTFEQRCERIFPNEPAFQERCVEHLSHGDPA